MENQYQDFDHELTQMFVNFVDNLPPGSEILANQLRQAILKRTCGLKTRSRTIIAKFNNTPEPIFKIFKKKDNLAPLQLFDFDELEIARQLTILEFDYYEKILPTEFLRQQWSKPATQYKSANILAMIARANDVSLWVAALVSEPTRVKVRASRFTKLIKIAEHLRALNNFSTLMAFLGGFNNAAVTRLKFTRQLLPNRSLVVLGDLEKVMSVDQSYKIYRESLKVSNPPCIPYLGTHLSDLTFIDEGNPDLISGLINIGKWVLTYKQIADIHKYQNIAYNLRRVEGIAKFVRDIPSRDEKVFGAQLWEMSLSREPRGAEKVL